jgi:S-formylglutathione hydrolase FrmB
VLCFLSVFAASSFAPAQQTSSRIVDVSFNSAALRRTTSFTIVRPATDPPPTGYPVLVILHGLGRNHRTLIDNQDTLRLLLTEPYLIVLPDSQRGWWIDSDSGKYESMLIEIIDKVKAEQPVSRVGKDWAILGWSMGGFGAVHFAENHPDSVGFVGSIIGHLDFPRSKGLPRDQQFPIDTKVFGDDRRQWEHQNPCHHAAALRNVVVAIIIANEAFDRTMNEDFLRCANQAHLLPEVTRIEGEHVFTSVEAGLDILLPRVARYFDRTKAPAELVLCPRNT